MAQRVTLTDKNQNIQMGKYRYIMGTFGKRNGKIIAFE